MSLLNYGNIIDPLLKDVRPFILEFSGIKAGERVLDVACGTGVQALLYAKNGASACGVDIDPKMIALAQNNRRKSGLPAEFIVADGTRLPFKDNVFDTASICFALHETTGEDRARTISEVKRVVRGSGSLILVDFKVPLPKNV